MRVTRTARSVPQNLNALLGKLPVDDYQRLLVHLELVKLERRTVIHRQGAPVEHVYFPGGGLCSVASGMEDGETVIVAIVGREGLVGAPVLATDGTGITASMVLVGCEDALRLPIGVFTAEIDRRGVLYDAIMRYSETLVASIIQTAACNRAHTIEKRLPCWLLHAMGRLNNDEIPLTQETLAMMLGVRRASVTLAANTLQDAGLIKYTHGRIRIVDLGGLESASCGCYRATQKMTSYDRSMAQRAC